MKAGLSLQELAAEIERQQNTKVDYVVDTRQLQVAEGGKTLVVDDAGEDGSIGEFNVTEHTHGQIAGRLGIPKEFYDRLRNGKSPKKGARIPAQPTVYEGLVNGLFALAPEKRMVRTLDGNARAMLSNRYRALDNYDLAQAVLPIISDWASKEEAQILSADVTETKFYLKVVLPKIQRQDPGRKAKIGDLIQSGFVVENSEVGAGSLAVYPLVYTLSCLNGMIRQEEGLRKYHVGRAIDAGYEQAYGVFSDRTLSLDDQAYFAKVQDLVKATADQAVFDSIVARMEAAANSEPITDPVGAVERITGKFTLTEGESKSILAHLITGGDLSAYGALNAITRASQDVKDYDRATELEKVGGKMLDLTGSEWREIAASKTEDRERELALA